MGDYQLSIYSWILLFSALAGGSIGVSLWRRRKTRGARYLAFLTFAVTQWSTIAAIKSAAPTVSHKMFWSQIEYLGITSCPVLFLFFALCFTLQDKYLSRRNMVLLLVIPAITMFIAAVQPKLIWAAILIDPQTNLGVYRYGPWLWVFAGYSYLILLSGIILLFFTIFRFPELYKSQTVAVTVGAILPVVGDILFVFKLSPIPGLELTPIAFVASVGILGWGIFRFRMFDLVPMARDMLIDKMNDGVLVIDDRGHIVDMNPSMQAVTRLTRNKSAGRPIGQAFSHQKGLLNNILAQTDGQCEIQLEGYKGKQSYDLLISSLYDHRGQFTGKLIVLRNISAYKKMAQEREQLITELQELLTKVKTLSGLLPICANCKNIRDDDGYWHDVAVYIKKHSDVDFTHGICPECTKKLYPHLSEE
jgi:PAS domain-containing protein